MLVSLDCNKAEDPMARWTALLRDWMPVELEQSLNMAHKALDKK